MALIFCPECGKKVSDQGAACPHCGFPVEKAFTKQCGSCNSMVDANAKFCTVCGQPFVQMGPDIPSGGIPEPPFEKAMETPDVPVHMGNERTGRIRGGMVAAVLVLIAAVLLAVFWGLRKAETKPDILDNGQTGQQEQEQEQVKPGETAKPSKQEPVGLHQVYALAEDGALVVLNSGETLNVTGNIVSGSIAPDEKHFVFLDANGTLFMTDAKGEQQETIAEEVEKVTAIRNSGVMYQLKTQQDPNVSDRKQYMDFGKYVFDTKEQVNMGKSRYGRYAIGYKSLTILFFDGNTVSLYPDSSVEPEVLSTPPQGVVVQCAGVSNDGKIAVWGQTAGAEDDYGTVNGTTEIYLKEGADSRVVDTLEDNMAGGLLAEFTPSQDEFVLYDTSGKLYAKHKDEAGLQEMKVNGTMSYQGVFGENGKLVLDETATTDNFYAVGWSGIDQTSVVYRFDKSGNGIKIADGLHSVVSFRGGKCFVIAGDGSLCAITLSKELSSWEPQVLAADVWDAKVSQDGSMVYFRKDAAFPSNGTWMGPLYRLSVNDSNAVPEKLGDDCAKFWVSQDGSAVAYQTGSTALWTKYDNFDDGGTSTYGELYYAKVGNEPVKIGSDVIDCATAGDYNPETEGFYEQGYLDNQKLLFTQFFSKDDQTGTARSTVQLFDGQNSQVLARDVYLPPIPYSERF